MHKQAKSAICDLVLDLRETLEGEVERELAFGPYRDGQPPYDPDLDDGVKVNILPLQAARILPYKRVV